MLKFELAYKIIISWTNKPTLYKAHSESNWLSNKSNSDQCKKFEPEWKVKEVLQEKYIYERSLQELKALKLWITLIKSMNSLWCYIPGF